MYYVFDTGSELAAAKEIRLLGTLPWWRARADSESAAYLDSLWRDRRRIFLAPFIGFSAIVLAGAAGLLVTLAAQAEHGRLSVLGLALSIQSILVAMRFGVFFPEADVQTQYGMQAHDSIQSIASSGAAPAGRPASPANAKPATSPPSRRSGSNKSAPVTGATGLSSPD